MAQSLQVLTKIDWPLYNMQPITGTKQDAVRLYNTVADVLSDELDAIESIVPPEDINTLSYAFGLKKPDAIIKEAERWNDLIGGLLLFNAKHFQRILANRYNSDNFAENLYRAAMESMNGTMDNDTQRKYDVCMYSLTKSLNSVNNEFVYGEQRYVLTDANSTGSIQLRSDVKQDVLAHPEKYAVIELLYK